MNLTVVLTGVSNTFLSPALSLLESSPSEAGLSARALESSRLKIVTETGSFDLAPEISEAVTDKIMTKLLSHGDPPPSKKFGA
jgi:hypothetical protein